MPDADMTFEYLLKVLLTLTVATSDSIRTGAIIIQ